MSQKFLYSLGGVLPQRLSLQVRELYWAALLQNLALAMLLLFEPIYLWQQGLGLRGIITFFLGVYVCYFLLMPLGAKFACRFSYKHSMALSTLFQVLYYLTLYLVAQSYLWLVPTALLYALQKTFYWPAYHADFTRYSDHSEEGREISGLSVALSFVYIVGPLLAGFILSFGSWMWLFVTGCGVLLLSNWPLLSHREEFTPRTFSYVDTYRRLLSTENRRPLLGYMGFGEELVALVLWPVFISVIVVNYVEIGGVVATATLLTALITLYIGKLTDERNKHQVLRWSAGFYALSWVARFFVTLPLQVFVVDSWSRLAKNVVAVPLTAITYDRAQGGSVMDTVVFFEMSLAVGKLLACLVLLAVFTVATSLHGAFIAAWTVAALMTLLYVLV